ncbi:MAG: type III-B CRISPR-associated protein Cas10/Cmr2 [Rubrivivax sp.]
MTPDLWKRKLAAWLHDPAEKALVLMRDVDNAGQRIGHEEGSVAELRAALGIRRSDFDQRADHWAAAADRPQWPCEDGRPRPAWANVRFVDQPVLIHPLSGEQISLSKLTEVHAAQIRTASLDHFSQLIERRADGEPDHRLTHLAFWRFGPEPALVAPELGELWRLLPADTRVPDHSIWQHLDVVSALSGATAGGAAPALLTMSFGPVQGFIAQARSTSDLWAGSHLLSSLVWQGLAVLCEVLGPDAVLFPNLRGVAAVDRWLLQQAPHWRERFETIDAPWLDKPSDANPLFAATLPNKFMAIVPAGRARELAGEVTRAVRDKALAWANQAAGLVFAKAGRDLGADAHWHRQIAEQVHGFPDVHWSVAEWPTATDDEGFPDADALEQALAAFYPADCAAPGFFADPFWGLVSNADRVEIQGRRRTFRRLRLPDGEEFFVPNPGLLYPAVHDLAERGLAAAKALRPFDALAQRGFRCTLSGEHEWLTDDPRQLALPPKARQSVSAWGQAAGSFGIKAGEHLGAIATLKRLWPTLFAAQVSDVLQGEKVSRFVVSTHTMALATPLARLAGRFDGAAQAGLAALEGELEACDPAVLPASLAASLHRLGPASARALRRLPAMLDHAREAGDEGLQRRVGELFGNERPETYYALIQMDGDRMGAWMAGNEPGFQRRFADTWHPQVRAAVTHKFGHLADVERYLESWRPASPARHAAISAVLNDFSTHVAHHIVEQVFKGKLIYAGGDDVLAMVSVDDLLPCMLLLRAAYSGVGEWSSLPGFGDLKRLALRRGYVALGDRLLPMMGTQASASMGAVVAHHQAPLAAVLRELRRAEQQAKRHRGGGRNAFCLRVMKRGGGEVGVTSRFWSRTDEPPPLQDSALGLMLRFSQTLGDSEMSRRAVYNTAAWLAGLPARDSMCDPDWRDMVVSNLAMQLERQGGVPAQAAELVKLACDESAAPATARMLEELLVCAEFFAREGRAFGLRKP